MRCGDVPVIQKPANRELLINSAPAPTHPPTPTGFYCTWAPAAPDWTKGTKKYSHNPHSDLDKWMKKITAAQADENTSSFSLYFDA